MTEIPFTNQERTRFIVMVARRAYMPFGVTSNQDAPQVKDAYFDPRFLARGCDNCGKVYNGPAVYCSLACALADA